MDGTEKEIKKLRDEAAKYRTQLSPYKKAFANFDEDAVAWLLETINMVSATPQEAGRRFATLAYGNMGKDHFKEWIDNVVYDDIDEDEGEEIEMVAENYNEAPVEEPMAASALDKIMARIDAIDEKIQMRDSASERQEQFKTIQNKIEELGYEQDSWQAKMVLQVASQEVDAEQDVSKRLEDAHAIVSERLGTAPEGGNESAAPQTGISLEEMTVPATGGNVGGGGVPNINENIPITFGDADEALMNLVRSEIGQ